VVEPRLSDQWFVKMKPLAEPALAAVRDGRIRIVPERWEGVYVHWLDTIRDWNISRQLWWGHRIPVWYCDGCGRETVSREDVLTCPSCSGPVRQDEDVLDTWFSSWLWPFSTLGWPKDTPDLRAFYPTDVLVSGPDILFFWVARMIMSGFEFMGEAPYHTVYLHGIARDTKHRKMSKSLGNGIDPLDVIARFGADPLRYTVVAGMGLGVDIIFDPDDLEKSFAPAGTSSRSSGTSGGSSSRTSGRRRAGGLRDRSRAPVARRPVDPRALDAADRRMRRGARSRASGGQALDAGRAHDGHAPQ
jgi:valyl-tRNA synthetase